MSEKLPRVDARRLIKILKKIGFVEQRQRGSHLRMKRLSDGRRLTIPVHRGQELRTGTLRSILDDADLTVTEFRKLLGK